MGRISEGGKAANEYLRAQGKNPEFHDGASLANIVSGYPVQDEPRFRETARYLKNAHMTLEDDKVHELIRVVREAMSFAR